LKKKKNTEAVERKEWRPGKEVRESEGKENLPAKGGRKRTGDRRGERKSEDPEGKKKGERYRERENFLSGPKGGKKKLLGGKEARG